MEMMFQEEDVDHSSGLSANEFQQALDRWGGHCSVMKTNFFCSGGWGIKCCRSGWGWHKCGSFYHHHNCWGGGGSRVGWSGGNAGWLQEGDDTQATREQGQQDKLEKPQDEYFLSKDADGDGEVQFNEVTSLIASLGNYSAADMEMMFQEEDLDHSSGLSANEFQEALDRWGGHCSVMKTNFFCSGGWGIKCCRSGW